MNASRFARLTLGVALVAASAAHATNGYLSHGYGTRTKGTAGVAAALPQDALVIAANPAGLIALEDRIDIGVERGQRIRSGPGFRRQRPRGVRDSRIRL
jgi:long-chain fatty acid transport protein